MNNARNSLILFKYSHRLIFWVKDHFFRNNKQIIETQILILLVISRNLRKKSWESFYKVKVVKQIQFQSPVYGKTNKVAERISEYGDV